MKIYTRTGDQGTSQLFNGQRLSKNCPTFAAIGTVDEVNSALGSAISLLPEVDGIDSYREQLTTIQHALFDLGAALATPRTQSSEQKISKTRFDGHETGMLESWIDEMTEKLPPLKTFILPGGHPAGAMLHLSRSLVRRAEREVIPCFENKDVTEDMFVYLNRLSDYLFTAARMVNQLAGINESAWEPHKA